MDCEKFDKGIMALLYGELDELSEAAALRHLHHCTRCRDIWAQLRTTRELSELPQEDPPEDLFESIIAAEAHAKQSLSAREKMSRTISVLAGYAMRPQLAMAAILLLMIGSSLVFVRHDRADGGHVSVTEVGTPHSDQASGGERPLRAQVFADGREMRGVEDDESEEDGSGEIAAAPSTLRQEQRIPLRQTYSDAMAAYQQGRYAEAERLFSEVASGGGEQAASAALHEGHAARNGSGCQRAAALYDAVAERYSGSTVAAEASWHAASCYRALGQLARAQAHYRALAAHEAYRARAKTAVDELTVLMAPAESDKNAKTTAVAAPPAQASGTSPVTKEVAPANSDSAETPEAEATPEPNTTPTPEAPPAE